MKFDRRQLSLTFSIKQTAPFLDSEMWRQPFGCFHTSYIFYSEKLHVFPHGFANAVMDSNKGLSGKCCVIAAT